MRGPFRFAMPPGLAVLTLLLILLVLFAGLLPLIMPMGFAAGGVLDTGQAEPSRWWLGSAIASGLYVTLTWRTPVLPRLWWLGALVGGIVFATGVFCWRASLDQPRFQPNDGRRPALTGKTGIVSALPLFWPEGRPLTAMLEINGEEARSPVVDILGARAIDAVNDVALAGLDSIILAQPRLLRPEELVALDSWLAKGGKAVIFADPLLMWPTSLSMGDPRRPPLTSLLDPLLAHWGLRLEPVAEGASVQRRMLSTGHVLIVAGASRFTLTQEGARGRCMLTGEGLMALCRIGAGKVRLIADADLIDDRLWLADKRWPDRTAAHASDIIPLLRVWAADPFLPAAQSAPRRVTSEKSLTVAMRLAIGAAFLWGGLGWLGHARLLGRRRVKWGEGG